MVLLIDNDTLECILICMKALTSWVEGLEAHNRALTMLLSKTFGGIWARIKDFNEQREHNYLFGFSSTGRGSQSYTISTYSKTTIENKVMGSLDMDQCMTHPELEAFQYVTQQELAVFDYI